MKARWKTLHRFVLACVACGSVFLSVSASADDRDMRSDARMGNYGSAVTDRAAARPLIELPKFNRDSGDLVFDLQGSIGAAQTNSEIVGGGGFYVSPLTNHRAAAEQTQRARVGDRREVSTWDVGAVIGYELSEPAEHSPSGRINLQVVTDSDDPQAELLLQPGVDYVIPMSSSWELNARVFSTYAPEERSSAGAHDDRRQRSASAAENEQGWREVGVNVGLGYNVSETWKIQTQAGITRSLGDSRDRNAESEEDRNTDIFGGVFLNYQF